MADNEELVSRMRRELDRDRPFDRALAEEAVEALSRYGAGGEAVALDWPPLIELGRVLGFFASCIKSGEAWSATCDAEYAKANAALQALYAIPTQTREAVLEEAATLVRQIKTMQSNARREGGLLYHEQSPIAKTLGKLEAALASSPAPEPPYVPKLIRNEEGQFLEFVERDVPTVTGQMMAMNVEPIYDMSTRVVIGYRLYDDALFGDAPSPEPAVQQQATNDGSAK